MKEQVKIIVVDANKEISDGYERAIKSRDLDLYFKEKTIKALEKRIKSQVRIIERQDELIALQENTIKSLREMYKM